MPQIKLKNQNKTNRDKSNHTLESLADAYRNLSPYLNIGYVWAASVILLTLLGWYLDKQWGTKPWLTLLGAILGVFAGFVNFFKTVMTEDNDDQPS